LPIVVFVIPSSIKSRALLAAARPGARIYGGNVGDSRTIPAAP
jgi:hypothetical protein